MEAESSTQLADNRPQFDTALRVALPVNVPQRTGKKSREELIGSNAFSPSALALGKSVLVNFNTTGKLTSKSLPPLESAIGMDHNAQIKTAIRDFTVLAFSSKRADKKEVEASAYLSLGIIHDNQGNYLLGIENYKLYLQICEEIGDVMGSARACNCLGVDFMLLASPPSDVGLLQGMQHTGVNSEYLEQAIHYHSKHLEIGPDSGGRFVANTNVGLCLGLVGDIVQSAKHQQDALRIAIKMQTLYGQSLAVANLGMLALLRKDHATARTCFEQHLQLVQTLSDAEAEITAWKMLARASTAEDNLTDALDELDRAREIAAREGCANELRRIHCLIGICKGTLDFAAHTEGLLRRLQAGTLA